MKLNSFQWESLRKKLTFRVTHEAQDELQPHKRSTQLCVPVTDPFLIQGRECQENSGSGWPPDMGNSLKMQISVCFGVVP